MIIFLIVEEGTILDDIVMDIESKKPHGQL